MAGEEENIFCKQENTINRASPKQKYDCLKEINNHVFLMAYI